MEIDVPVTIACGVGIAALCLFLLWLDNMNRHASPGQGRKELDDRRSIQSINANTNEFIREMREMREKGASEPSGGSRKQDTQS
ncbi:MAG: hypothetical protein ABIO92_08730, partial [Chloroflexia bacterium]